MVDTVEAARKKTVNPRASSPVKKSSSTASYQNFNLPTAHKIYATPESSTAFASDRVKLHGKSIKLDIPTFNATQFAFAKETFLSEKRDEAIRLLRQQLDSGYQVNRDNMLLRLGQLYAEKYMELSYKENEVFTEQINDYEAKKGKDKKAKAPGLDNRRSKQYLTDALRIFYQLEKGYPKHPKMDEIVYFIGFVELESNNQKRGVRYLERLLKDYPRSKKYEEALLYLGDHYFESLKFKLAYEKYAGLARRKNSELYDYCLYKISWCQLNLGQAEKGLDNMKSLVKRLEGTEEKAKFNLKEQAVRDLIVFYTELGQVDEAMDFYTSIMGRDKAFENLRLMADILKSKAKDEAAIKAYDRLLAEYGDAAEAPKFELGRYDSAARLGKRKSAIEDLETALIRYGSESPWLKNMPKEKRDEAAENSELLRAEVTRVAMFSHQVAQKGKEKAGFETAVRLYRALVENYPKHPERRNLLFYQAEIRYNQGKWSEAAEDYLVVSKMEPKDKMTDDSVYNALLALDNLTEKAPTLERFNKDDQKKVVPTPQTITENEKRFLSIADRYIKEYPKATHVVDVKFRVASLYYTRFHWDEAQPRLKDIAVNYPKHRSATTAAHLVLDIYNMKSDYASLGQNAQEFASHKELGDDKFRNEMNQIQNEISFKVIEKLEAGNRWKDAGDAYYDFFKKNPQSTLAEQSLYNAYVSYDKASSSQLAAETSRLFLAKYPNSEHSERFRLAQAKESERIHDYQGAYEGYLAFWKKYPKSKEAIKALYNAAVFGEVLEKNQSSLELYEDFLKVAKSNDDEKRSILISQAKLHRRLGHWDKTTKIYRQLAAQAKTKSDKMSILGELTRQYDVAGRSSDKNNLIRELVGLYDQGATDAKIGIALFYVAEAKFRAVDRKKAKYFEIPLRFPPEDLLYLMKRKQKALAQLGAEYDSVTTIGAPEWGVASIWEKAAAYEHFAQTYRKVKVTGKYKGQEKEEAEKSLKDIEEKLIVPMDKQHVELVNLCTERAINFRVDNEFSQKCFGKLKDTQKDLARAEVNGVMPQPIYWSTYTRR